ncbi:CDP-diacylglycerol--glycerol-3-phosphate 3-phosphatidyltransferase [Ferruginivarius sediminum]|uniref:CDP-diacylglycerol--glycerol-3-phosphate 3-phosphatidyltransferase n=1 Tax=Ferruginivarius sediminum TaxID=2661937 RepID=A0A369THN7_9PROT|nr:CDP-diacylglycerol--glycerol-3-phosphate 3-phosphatidyltransferase [Ferruginivarius sediminum]RDD62416.1 CDP-diacylglycerol--glycerol-3-phosphate 3-phosphatidyltransferase [Ferruginivarius sediminum]
MLTSLPNILTLSRIVVLPVIVALLYWTGPWASWIALAIFVVASVTDWLDGYIARLWNEVSPLGRFLDPIADKLLVAAVIVMLVASERVTGLVVLPALVILCREILVSGLREYLAEIRVPMPVSRLAKWKTALQMVALGILIVGEAGPPEIPLRLIGEVGLWIAAGLTMITGYDYLVRGLQHMRGDAAKPAEKKA